MKKISFSGLKYILLFIGISLGLTILLVGISSVTNENIEKNMKKSAEFFKDFGGGYEVISGLKSTRIIVYADSVIFNIILNLDRENILKSIINANIYAPDKVVKANDFYESYNERQPANQDYLRYWHGSIIPITLMLNIFSVKEMSIFIAVILILLIIALCTRLYKISKLAVIALIIGLIVTNSYIIPIALHYSWVYIIMLVVSIVLMSMEKLEKEKIYVVFFVTRHADMFF